MRSRQFYYPIVVGVDAKLYLRWLTRNIPLLWRLPISNVGSGPVGFLHRVMSHSPRWAVRFRPYPLKPDVFLGYVMLSQGLIQELKKQGAPLLLRLDGLFERSTPQGMEGNEEIRRTYLQSDGVIFQSQFARRIIEEAFGPPPNRATVIHNGAPLQAMHRPTRRQGSGGRLHLLTLSRWHAPHKRVPDTVHCFLSYPQGENFDLFIGGSVPHGERIEHSRVHYLGHLHPAQVARTLSSCAALLHLGWFDWCPNTVVEALVAGIPVICTNRGGTPELVRGSGIIIENDDEELHWPLDWSRPVPPLAADKVHAALDRILEGKERFDLPRPDLRIDRAAMQYLRFYEQNLDDQLMHR